MRSLHSLLAVTATAGALLAASGEAQAATPRTPVPAGATIYVSPSGDDTNAGTTPSKPLATLQVALRAATGGQTVKLAAGSYAWARDDTARSLPVSVVPAGDGAVAIDGLNVNGGQNITFKGLTFTESVRISMHQVLGARQPSKGVSFVNDDISSAKGSHCVVLRDAVQDVTFDGNTVHDCRMGFAGAGGAAPSSGITIKNNTIRHLFSDGIQFGDWNDVTIADNTIQDIHDPAGYIHNDAIQLTGDSSNVLISGNYLADSDGQLIIMQPKVGPVDNVRILNNVLTQSDAIPIQSFGVSRLVIAQNTIWFGSGHGIMIRSGGGFSAPDVVVVNNLVTALETYDGGKIAYASGNVTYCPRGVPGKGLPAGVMTCLTGAPDFVSPATGDFRLAPSSPLRNTVAAAAVKDRGNALRPVVSSPGAYN